jgi:hypothetical protein
MLKRYFRALIYAQLLTIESSDEAAAFAQIDRERGAALQGRVLNFDRGGVVPVVAKQQRAVLAFAQE